MGRIRTWPKTAHSSSRPGTTARVESGKRLRKKSLASRGESTPESSQFREVHQHQLRNARMFYVVATARNVMGMILGEGEKPEPTVEVVLIGHKPSYGLANDGRLGKGLEIGELRFAAGPEGLRHVAARLLEFANEAE